MRSNFYRFLLVLNSIIALFFLGLIVMGSYSVSSEVINPLSERQILTRQIGYGLIVSLFFSILSLVIGFLFKKMLNKRNLKLLFLRQFLLLLLGYTIICLILYLK